MSSKPTEPRSIASQLVLLSTISAAFLLSCGLGVFYWIVVRQAFAEDNAVLADKLFAIRSEINNPEGLRAIEDQLSAVRPGEQAVYWVRVIDRAGRAAAESPGMGELLPAKVFPVPSTSLADVKATDYRTGARVFSMVAVACDVSGGSYTIQVAQDRSGDKALSRKFGALLAGVLGIGIIAAALIAARVTRRGLLPLSEMARSVARIGATKLHARLGPRPWPRELQPMAQAFDAMLMRLEDSFTRLSQFSADLAHELRTPIANILGEAEVILTRDRSIEEYREVIESCVTECTRLSGIIDNLLFLARAESVDRQIQSALVDGRAALEKIASYYGTVAEEQGITVTCAGQGKLYADPLLLGRALSNLMGNALRFTSRGGEIKLSIRCGESSTEVSVQDTGEGIPSEHIPRVFDRFYRVDASRSSGGTGLGLALVKSIVELHDGSVSLQSERGRGTTVILTFPARERSEAEATPGAAPAR